MQNATEHGTLVVAAAGNDGPALFSASFPGSAPYTVAVGATDQNNNVAYFSSVGPTTAMEVYPSVVTPGWNIIAPLSSGSGIAMEKSYYGSSIIAGSGTDNYVEISGTSMATPMVAGAAALLFQQYPTLNPVSCRIALMEGVKDLGVSVEQQGAGLISVPGAVAYLNAHASNINNLTRVYPKSFPVEPMTCSVFPAIPR